MFIFRIRSAIVEAASVFFFCWSYICFSIAYIYIYIYVTVHMNGPSCTFIVFMYLSQLINDNAKSLELGERRPLACKIRLIRIKGIINCHLASQKKNGVKRE